MLVLMEAVVDSTAKKILEVIEKEGCVKARRIAQVLGLERKEVNHYLYSDLRNICVQNDKYEWSLASMGESREEHTEKTNSDNVLESAKEPEQLEIICVDSTGEPVNTSIVSESKGISAKVNNETSAQKKSEELEQIEMNNLEPAEMNAEEIVIKEDIGLSEGNESQTEEALENIIKETELETGIRDNDNSEERKPRPKSYRDDLERICNYYLQCIASERQDGIQVYAESKFDLKYREVTQLPRWNSTYSDDINDFIQKIMTSQSVVGYFGYPVLMKVASNGTKRLAPVFMWEIDRETGKVDFSQIPEINIELIKHYVTRSSEAVERELIHLEQELGIYDAEYLDSLDELLHCLQQFRKWQWVEILDSKKLSTIPFSELSKEGIYNKGIVLSETVSPFTKGLTKELRSLAEIPLEQCKGTALYDWINNMTEGAVSGSDNSVIEVLPLNKEQRRSVEKALSNKLTVVTGPPGTGKSQVVISILINEVFNGKSVLFSSKNTKAVDVVIKRANGITNTPFIARLGGSAGDREFSETLSKLLVASEAEQNSVRYEEQKNLLLESLNDVAAIEKAIAKKIETRNTIDRLDKELEPLRDKYDEYFKGGNIYDYAKEKDSWNSFLDSRKLTIKDQQPLMKRLRWKTIGPEREADAQAKYSEFRAIIGAADLEIPSDYSQVCDSDVAKITEQLSEHFTIIDNINKLKSAREEFRIGKSIEGLEKEQVELKRDHYDIAEKYWGLWLKQNNTALSAKDKKTIVEYLNGTEILKGQEDNDTVPDEVKKLFSKVQKNIPKYINAQAVTLLSAKGRIPFEPGCFDLLVIDEASQCDIASAIPLLYRAKRVVVIGDLMQLPHVSTMARGRDMQLLKDSGVDDLSWLYSVSPLFKLATSRVGGPGVVTLREHHRSHADIIDFSNKEFYGGDLITATDYKRLELPAEKEVGVQWIDVVGTTRRPTRGSATNEEEADAICEKLSRYASVDYKGTIGVISPFRAQANLIEKKMQADEEIYNKLKARNLLDINTVHQFQGDEKDIILFSQTISNGAKPGQVNFLKDNGNLFNVAITRAKALLISVGNEEYCQSCEVPYLRHFVKYIDDKAKENRVEVTDYDIEIGGQYPQVPNMDQVSDWEILFYKELYKRGVRTMPQYPVDKYKLDLAIVKDENIKLDIEVDGEAYHKTWDGELCYRDQLRNQRLFELGWDVRRFWVPDIRDNIEACIDEIIKWMDEHGVDRI